MSAQSPTQTAQSRSAQSAQSKPKRQNGQGTVYQIRSGPDAGRWRCAVSLEGGKRRTFFGSSREQVEAKLLDFRQALAHNAPLPPPRTLTVEAYSSDWLTEQKDHIRPSTWAGYAANVRHHIIPSLGKTKLADLSPADVRRMHRESKGRGLSPRSVRYVAMVLNRILGQALADGLVSRNVAALAKAPSAPKARIEPWSPQEALRFLDEVKGDEHEALYVVALGLGLRRGEVLGLRWRDVRFADRTITIAGQLQRVSYGGLQWVAPKTDGSVAVLDAPQFVLDSLLAHRDRQMFVCQPQPDDYIFSDAQGTPHDPDAITHAFPRFCERHGLRKTRFHDLRHASASLLLAKGVPMWMVSKLLRHSSLSVTADLYSHLYSEQSRQSADAMDEFMSQAK
jgi:integrase